MDLFGLVESVESVESVGVELVLVFLEELLVVQERVKCGFVIQEVVKFVGELVGELVGVNRI